MSDFERDRDLRSEFDGLRAEVGEPGRLPDFDVMIGRVRSELAATMDEGMPPTDARPGPGDAADVVDLGVVRRRRLTRLGGWVSLATAAAAVGVMLVSDPGPGAADADAEFEQLVLSYSSATRSFASPTDALLDIPGVDLGSVPSVSDGLRGFVPSRDEPGSTDGRDS